MNRIWTVEAENLIPQLKEIIADPEVQTFLAPLPQQTQEKLYQFLGERIEQVSTAAARKDTLETASLRGCLETLPFVQSLHQARILILTILAVFPRLESSPSLTLNKIESFSTGF
ncbi:MAG: hypothetical protein V1736_01935 [Pseudomonadota bacterium]